MTENKECAEAKKGRKGNEQKTIAITRQKNEQEEHWERLQKDMRVQRNHKKHIC